MSRERKTITKRCGAFVLLSTCGSVVFFSVAALLRADTPPPQAPMPASKLSAKDTALLEKIQRRTFGYLMPFERHVRRRQLDRTTTDQFIQVLATPL